MEIIPHSQPFLTEAEGQAVARVMSSKMIAAGSLTQEFEAQVARRLDMGAARSLPSGALALKEALLLVGVSAGGEVIVPTYVCGSVADAVSSIGALPVFCDVNENGCIGVDQAAEKISKVTQAIVAVHMFGHSCAVRELELLGFPVIEDACQAFGFEMVEGLSGGIGSISVLSFHATKCLTTGEGGMLLVRQADAFVDHKSLSTPLSDLQSAIGIQQLDRYDGFLSRRREIAARYDTAILAMDSAVQRKQTGDIDLFRYVVTSARPYDDVAQIFAKCGVQVRRGVDALLHRQNGQSDDCFPVATKLFERNVSIPFYPSLENGQVERVIQALEGIAT